MCRAGLPLQLFVGCSFELSQALPNISLLAQTDAALCFAKKIIPAFNYGCLQIFPIIHQEIRHSVGSINCDAPGFWIGIKVWRTKVTTRTTPISSSAHWACS